MRNLLRSALIGILFCAVIFYISGSRYLTFLATLASINAIAVLGIVLISGYTGQLNLGQAAFVGVGAYTSAILNLRLGLSFWYTIPIAIGVSAFFGILMGIPALKLKGGPYLALATQLFGEIVYLVIMNLERLTGGPFGLMGMQGPIIAGQRLERNLQHYFYFCLFVLCAAYFVCKRIVNSSLGLVFMGIRESEDAEQSLGINTMYYKILCFAVAAALGGLAGTLYGPFVGYISPDQFRWTPSLLLVSMAIVGGINKLEGGIAGAVLLTFLPELLRLTDQFRLIMYGFFVIMILALFPEGLMSFYGSSWKEILSQLKKRLAILSGNK